MIKAEDLRIGDLVKVGYNCMFPEETICVVTEIDSETASRDQKGFVSLNFPDDNDDGPCGVWCCNIEGIRLTSEILENNGWKRDKLVSYIYGHDAHNIEVICPPNSECVDVTLKGDTLHRIKYVHELQHILWALGEDANIKI